MFLLNYLGGDIIFYNVKEKIYFDGKKQVIVYKDYVIDKGFNRSGGNHKFLIDKLIDGDIGTCEYEFRKNINIKRSVRRTLNEIYDISRCNCWELFVTLTFNPDKVDSFDYDEVTKKLKNWLDTIRRKSKDLKYLIVPELHKSGRYHFHGLFANVDYDKLKLIDSGKRTNTGLVIYNIDSYRWGFSTATKVKNTNAVNKYIAKYVTKDLAKNTMYRRRYWASRNCNKPKVLNKYVEPELLIKSLETSRNLISKQVKQYTYVNDDGEEFKSEVIYYELDC